MKGKIKGLIIIFIFQLMVSKVAISQQVTADSGIIYYREGIALTREYEFLKARESLLRAQVWFYRNNRYEDIGNTFIQLGYQTNRMHSFEESHTYFKKAENIAHIYDYQELLFKAQMATALTHLWEYILARDTSFLHKGYTLLKGLENMPKDNLDGETMNDYLEAWGDYYLKTGKTDSALYYFNTSFEIAVADSNYLSMVNCYLNKAWVYQIKNDPAASLENMKQAEVVLGYEANLLHAYRLYNLYHQWYRWAGDYQKAYHYFYKAFHLMKKGLVADRELALSELTSQYENKILEEELRAKESAIQYQKWLIGIISGILFLAILFVILYFRLYKENKKISNKNSLLLREQNHRLKNNLQIISGLLSLQANRIQEEGVRDIIEASQFRVHAIGLIHKQLYDQGTEDLQIHPFACELINQIIVSFGIQQLDRDIQIEKISLPSEVANSIGLIINELLTNSCKYAFPLCVNPGLTIHLLTQDDGSIKLLYKDNGPGFSIKEAQGKPTFGLTLINIQVAQLEGKSKWRGTDGLTFYVVFRVERRLSLKERMKRKRTFLN